MEAAEGISGGPLVGGFSAVNNSFLWGAEANARSNLLCNCDFFLDGLVGFRTLGLYESLDVRESITQILPTMAPGGAIIPPGSTFNFDDNYKTRNQFYGTQIGTVAEFRRGPWSLNVTGKVGLGVTNQNVTISGSQFSSLSNGTTQSLGFGVLANPNIIGSHSRNVFTVVPEVGVNVGYQLTDNLRLFVGYNFLYWSSVVRPGMQINRGVNPTMAFATAGVPVVGPPPPGFAFNSSGFWAQGLTVGMELRW